MTSDPKYSLRRRGEVRIKGEVRIRLVNGPLDGAEASLWAAIELELKLDALAALLVDGANARSREPGRYAFESIEDNGKRVVYLWQSGT